MIRYPRSLKVLRNFQRSYKVLAIETSCDDTCVALIDRPDVNSPPTLVSHQRESLASVIEDGGIIPTKAHVLHQQRLGKLVKKTIDEFGNPQIDLVCATRGPGMPGSLSVGYEFAKGLSIGWNVPIVGVHHMLGHLLIPRMISNGQSPSFPCVSLLASGGHTILVYSESVLKHEIIGETIDIAAGDAIDKCAKYIGIRGQMMGKELEKFVFGDDKDTSMHEMVQNYTQLSMDPHLAPVDLPNPLKATPKSVKVTKYSYSPFITQMKNASEKYYHGDIQNVAVDIKKILGFEIQDAIFGHTIYRTKIALNNHKEKIANAKDFVCSGGVGSNKFLRYLLATELKNQFQRFHFPDPSLCTDNAVMIGWAGIELFEKEGLTTDLEGISQRKWPLSNILDGADCWVKSKQNKPPI
ncbi:putative N(6)-L-threonylcarbamoyladenine synthase [Saccharomycopsis crataegensis]|uniref:N(6)-L-threonylcarbamoyladenine synthase n=1 Tax=Saccharomycopsis crataegensis TaxID=43959 RepID=A0AAV5QKD7_9ASCO|nr:putative N(6)-L-threonylcarbamoyladenine synthase [Saccharomycopsis crataegensis]